jgi:hypothetical protein
LNVTIMYILFCNLCFSRINTSWSPSHAIDFVCITLEYLCFVVRMMIVLIVRNSD